jgi:hypothetical protein
MPKLPTILDSRVAIPFKRAFPLVGTAFTGEEYG